MQGFVQEILPDPTWGNPRMARVIPKGDNAWGILESLRNQHPWCEYIPVIPVGIYDQAVRGYATPLMKMIGLAPHACSRKITGEDAVCKIRKKCVNAGPDCHPGPNMPECWEAPLVDFYASSTASSIARLWREGIYVLVVDARSMK